MYIIYVYMYTDTKIIIYHGVIKGGNRNFSIKKYLYFIGKVEY